jgi:hypothetical protein
VFIKSKLGNYGIKIMVAADAKYFYAYNIQYTLARLTEQGRRSGAFKLSKMSITHMEPEEVLPLKISL